jgi:hypothetical protein
MAKVCEQTGRAAEAQELSARAKAIREKNAQTAQAQAPSSSQGSPHQPKHQRKAEDEKA